MQVVYVAEDRVWLSRGGVLCQARVFGKPASTAPDGKPVATSPAQTPLEKELASKIAKTGPNEFQIDRGAVDRILEAQLELMKTPLAPDKVGDRVVGFRLLRVRPGSILATLGLQTGDRLVSLNGIEVTSTERMLEAYAKLQSRTIDRLTIHLVRDGKPTNIDYVIR
jgi:general secretion pathway protein C